MSIDLTPIIQAIISLCAVIITYKLIPYIKSKTTSSQWGILKVIANTAVTAAVSLANSSGEEKKAAAVETMNKALASAGLKVDTAVIEDSVEAAYQQIKTKQ